MQDLFSDQRLNSGPQHWKRGFLTTGLPGKAPLCPLFSLLSRHSAVLQPHPWVPVTTALGSPGFQSYSRCCFPCRLLFLPLLSEFSYVPFLTQFSITVPLVHRAELSVTKITVPRQWEGVADSCGMLWGSSTWPQSSPGPPPLLSTVCDIPHSIWAKQGTTDSPEPCH